MQMRMDGESAAEEMPVPEVSVAAQDTIDSVLSSTDLDNPTILDFPRSPRAIHTRHFSEDLSRLTIDYSSVDNGEQNSHDRIERTRTRGHSRHFSEDLNSFGANDLYVNKGEDHGLVEGKQLSRHNSVERNIYKAAEIAERFIKAIDNRVIVDTGAPIESVKDAVSKFGGILDWKERRKHVQDKLNQVHEDIPECQRKAEAAEIDKNNVLADLCSTRQIIERLKLNLEKAQTDEVQAEQDLELANIRLKEIQQGIAYRESAVTKAEVQLAKHRHASVLTELKLVKDEIEQFRKEYTSLNNQRDNAETKACESSAVSRVIENTVEDLTLNLITLKEMLTSAQAMQIIAEEQKINVASAYQQEKVDWQRELRKADEEVQELTDAISDNKSLESMMEAASALLVQLHDELSAYLDEKPDRVVSVTGKNCQAMDNTRLKLAKTRKELDDMRADIEKAKHEVKELWNAAATLRADLDREKTELMAMRHKDHLASVSLSSLQEELSNKASELSIVLDRIKAAEMPMELQHATNEAEEAKTKARMAHQEVMKVREEVDQVKGEHNVVLLRREAVSREILAMNASEQIAYASANALQEYRREPELQVDRRVDNDVKLSLEEYNLLIKKAQDADDLSKKQVIKAIEKIKEAKAGEVRSLDCLEQLGKQIQEKRLEMKAAQEKANSVQYSKLTLENELRKRRTKHEQQRNLGPGMKNSSYSFDATSRASNHNMIGTLSRAETIAATTVKESKLRKSFFQRSILTMFMTRKKAHSK